MKFLTRSRALKPFLTEVHKVLKLYLTIPVTTASSEHDFSALKCIKTYLRNSMVFHIHQERMCDIDLNSITKAFVQASKWRFALFFQIFLIKIFLDHNKIYLHAIINLIKSITMKSFSVYYPNISLEKNIKV